MNEQLNNQKALSEIQDTVAMAMMNTSRRIMTTVVDFQELLMRYTCALKEIQTKLEVLNTEYNVRMQRNPIVSIHTRLKQSVSIMEKMERLGIPFSLENVEKYLNDVAGVRVICSYLDDIYTLADALTNQDDVTLIRTKDYIRNPKGNGYRSLHLIVSIPVFFADSKRNMKVEVQIRTVAMDYWAELEHQLKYKQEVPNENEIATELKFCAEEMAQIDQKMLSIRKRIEECTEKPTEDEILLEKLQKISFKLE